MSVFRKRVPTSLAVLLLAGSAAVPPAHASTAGERITAVVADVGGGPGPNSASLTLHVEKWSSDEEVVHLAGVLREQGLDALHEELEELDYGWVRVGTSLGYPIAVARSIPDEEGGRTVRIVVDRPIGFLEVARGLRSEEYPLAVIEIRFDAEGRGEGTLAAAVRARFEGSTLIVESYGARPARIYQARVR